MSDRPTDASGDELTAVRDRLATAVERGSDTSGATDRASEASGDEERESADRGRRGSERDEAGDGWRTEVEVVERAAVPDTQDVLGRYAVTLDATDAVRQYGGLGRYHRDELDTRSATARRQT